MCESLLVWICVRLFSFFDDAGTSFSIAVSQRTSSFITLSAIDLTPHCVHIHSGANADKVATNTERDDTTRTDRSDDARAAPAAVLKPKTTAAEPLMDLLSMDDDASSSPKSQARGRTASTSSAAGLSSDVLAEVPKWLRAAAQVRVPTTKAVLLKSDLLTITVSADFRAHQARLAVFFDNTSNFDILNLKVSVACVASSAGAINVKQQDPSVRVSPGEETRLQLALESARPFSDAYPLEMDVKFTVSGSPYAYTLLLPVTASSFFEPLPSDKATYMGRWKSLDGADAEAQQVCQE